MVWPFEKDLYQGKHLFIVENMEHFMGVLKNTRM
jgi:hypothetical protein